MDRRGLKLLAKQQIKGNVLSLFVCYAIIFGACALAGLVPLIGPIMSVIIMATFSVNLCKTYLNLTKGEKPQMNTLFENFDNFGRPFILIILIGVFTFLWSLLFCIPGIIKGYSYSMAFYVMADNPQMTAREALRESKEITKGHKWELFVLQLSFFLWYLLCGITFGIASLYVVPYVSASVANFYNEIKRTPVEVQQEEEKTEAAENTAE